MVIALGLGWLFPWSRRSYRLPPKQQPAIDVEQNVEPSIPADDTTATGDSPSFQYSPLGSGDRIRLLRLLPRASTPSSTLSCQIFKADLSEAPEYEALSYVWGDVNDQVEIRLNGGLVSITRNLYSALRALRFNALPRIIWADALCIDQDNVLERNHQVAIMGSIYQKATQVVAWIGEAGDDSHLVIHNYRSRTDPGRRLSRECLIYDGKAQCSDFSYAAASEAEQTFFNRAYFFRTWVIQEVMVAQRAIVQCGQDTVPWGLLPVRQGIGDLGLQHRAVILCENPDTGMDRPREDIRVLLRYSQQCKVTEPRDKVFAMLNLVGRNLLTVDYRQTVAHVFTEFTKALIQLYGNIRCLHWLGPARSRDDLPSWVPDYTVTVPYGSLPQGTEPGVISYGYRGDREWEFNKRRGWDNIFVEGDYPIFQGLELREKGDLLDSIKYVGQELPLDFGDAVNPKLEAAIINSWETLALMAHPKDRRAHVAEVFAQTLVAQRNTLAENGEISDLLIGFYSIWQQGHQSQLLATSEPDTIRRLSVEAHSRRLSGGPESQKASYRSRMQQVCRGRRFFVSVRGMLGMAPLHARAGDRIVFLRAGLYPFVLSPDSDDGVCSMRGDCFITEVDLPYVGSRRHETWTSAAEYRIK